MGFAGEDMRPSDVGNFDGFKLRMELLREGQGP